MLIDKVDFNIGEINKAFKLILMVGYLIVLNSGFLYILLLNNDLRIITFLCDKLMIALPYFLVFFNFFFP